MANITNELKEKLFKANSAQEIVEMLKAAGQEFTQEEVDKLWEKISSKSLSLDDLSAVSGGAGAGLVYAGDIGAAVQSLNGVGTNENRKKSL